MFSTRKNSSFYLLTEDLQYIVTNNKNLKDFSYSSNTQDPSFSYTVSSFITGIMRFLNWTTSEQKNKIFAVLKRHMTSQYLSIQKRRYLTEYKAHHSGGKRTKTFFRFSHLNRTYYFGFHVPCTECQLPTTFITRHYQLCDVHFRALQKVTTPKPTIDTTHEGLYVSPRDSRYVSPDCIRKRMSPRLGIMYKKRVIPNDRIEYKAPYAVYVSNTELIQKHKKLSKKQIARLNRHHISTTFELNNLTPRTWSTTNWIHPYCHANFAWRGTNATFHKQQVPNSRKYDLITRRLVPIPPPRSQYYCNTCDFDPRTEKGLKQHRKERHKKPKKQDNRPNIFCPLCPKKKANASPSKE